MLSQDWGAAQFFDVAQFNALCSSRTRETGQPFSRDLDRLGLFCYDTLRWFLSIVLGLFSSDDVDALPPT